MFDQDNWQEIFNTFKRHKLRTALTGFGVFWGIFMLIFLLGTGKGMENGVMRMFGDMVSNGLFVWTNNSTMAYKGLKAGRRVRFTTDDVQAIQERFPEIQFMGPRLGMPSGLVTRNGKEGSFETRGEMPDAANILSISMMEGRFLNPLDIEYRRKIIVIGKRVRELLFEEEEEAIGEFLEINGTKYQIVGTYKSNMTGEEAADEEQTIFVPLTTAQQVLNMPNRVGWFVCAAYPNVNVSILENKIKTLLKERHSLHPDDPQAIRSFNTGEEYGQFQGLFIAINLFVGFIGIMTLLFGIVGVSNIMLIVVKERTKEIGVRKALGATPRSIINMILMESVLLTTFAGYLGLLAGIGIIAAINSSGLEHDFFANPSVGTGVSLGALLLLIISGTLAGLIPARQAAQVNPVVALKNE